MGTSWRELDEALADALGRSDLAAVERLLAALLARLAAADLAGSAQTADAADLLVTLGRLRRRRRFDLVERLAEGLLQSGDTRSTVVHHYGQALVERGAPAAALALLRGMLDDAARATPEVRGLEGRAWKEMFLAAAPTPTRRREVDLARAVAAYRSVYDADPTNRWHGINLAALLLRAEREGIRLDGVPDPGVTGREIASLLAGTAGTADGDDPWAWATAIEAAVALGRTEKALEHLRNHPAGAGAFELASLRRQLVEVWQLDPDAGPGAQILPPLEALLLRSPGGALTLVPAARGAPPAGGGFEKVFGAEGAQTQSWFEELLRRCRAVARVEDVFEEPVGTGFVLAGSDLHPSFPERVLLTNAHVVPDGIAAADARLTFRGLRTPDGTAGVAAGTMLWTSPVSELDATVLALPPLPAGVETNALADSVPSPGGDPPARVYVVGHPLGGTAVKISVLDNELLDADAVRLHYRAPTQPGSSGSPVYDDRWHVVALHHAGGDRLPRLTGGGVHAANEGIRLDAIRAALVGAPVPGVPAGVPGDGAPAPDPPAGVSGDDAPESGG